MISKHKDMQEDTAILIYTTFPTKDAAAAAGKELVARKLAACVNILPSMTSIYEWEGRLESSEEVVMLIKTRASLEKEAIAATKRSHSYDVPAILVINVVGGEEQYLRWVMEGTKRAEEN